MEEAKKLLPAISASVKATCTASRIFWVRVLPRTDPRPIWRAGATMRAAAIKSTKMTKKSEVRASGDSFKLNA